MLGGPHPEHSLADLVAEAGREQQAVQLLRPPVQQCRLHLLTRRVAPQQLIQDVQSLHHLRAKCSPGREPLSKAAKTNEESSLWQQKAHAMRRTLPASPPPHSERRRGRSAAPQGWET